MLESCRPFGDNGHVKMCLMKQSHSGVWGSKLYVFTEQIDQVMHFGLMELEALSSRSSGMHKAKVWPC